MKKILLISFMFFNIISNAQRIAIFSVQDSTTLFGQNIPAKSFVYSRSEFILFYIPEAGRDTATLSDIPNKKIINGSALNQDLQSVLELGSIADIDNVFSVTTSSDYSDISFISSNGAGNQFVSLQLGHQTSAFRFNDGRAIPTGIEYNADYSVNYTDRSLVDKAYVDLHAGSTDTTNLSDSLRITFDLTNSKMDSSKYQFHTLEIDTIHPYNSKSLSICNHNNSSAILFGDGVPKLGSISPYMGTYKGVDYGAGFYYESGDWKYSLTDYYPLSLFQNVNEGSLEFWVENKGVKDASITWTNRKWYIDNKGREHVDSISLGGVDLHSILNSKLNTPLTFPIGTPQFALVLENDTLKRDSIFNFGTSTTPRINIDTLTVGNAWLFTKVLTLIDDAYFDLPVNYYGVGNIYASNSASSYVALDYANTPHITNTYGLVEPSNTDGNICIFYNTDRYRVANRTGGTITITINFTLTSK